MLEHMIAQEEQNHKICAAVGDGSGHKGSAWKIKIGDIPTAPTLKSKNLNSYLKYDSPIFHFFSQWRTWTFKPHQPKPRLEKSTV